MPLEELPHPDQADPTLVVDTGPVETIDFLTTGVTWSADTAANVDSVSVRVREDNGWTGWNELEVLGDQAAGKSDRMGTEPLITNGADAVEVHIHTTDGTAPQDMELSLIDPGEAATDGKLVPAGNTEAPQTYGEALGEVVTGTNNAYTTEAVTKYAGSDRLKPRIVTRAQWGANESITSDSPRQAKLDAIYLHHTAGSNTYTQAGAYQQVRSVFDYHAGSLKWGDIGYHFLVDKFGTIYEGRRGAMTALVLGTQAGGFNTDTIGVTALGNYDTVEAPAAMVSSLEAVIAWQADRWGLDPTGTVTLTSRAAAGSTARYAYGTKVSRPTILGHRDTNSTACPGRYLYAKMGSIRANVSQRIGSSAIGAGSAPVAPKPATPSVPSAPSNTGYALRNDGMDAMASWEAVSGAAKYQIMFRAVPHGGGDVNAQTWIAGRTTTGTSLLLGADPGETAQFAVRALNASGIAGPQTYLGQHTGPLEMDHKDIHIAGLHHSTHPLGLGDKALRSTAAGNALRIEGSGPARRLVLSVEVGAGQSQLRITKSGSHVGNLLIDGGGNRTCTLELPAGGTNVRIETLNATPVKFYQVITPRAGQSVNVNASGPCATDFTDNKPGSNYYDSVSWMQLQGLTTGYADGSFGKNRAITRGESMAFVHRYLAPSYTPIDSRPFKDVSHGDTFFVPVSWAKSTGVSTGYSNGTFGVGRDVTRGEFASMLQRAVAPGSKAPGTSQFRDVKSSNPHHKAISWLYAEGLSTGYADGTYRPNQPITRAEISAVLYRHSQQN